MHAETQTDACLLIECQEQELQLHVNTCVLHMYVGAALLLLRNHALMHLRT